MKKRLMNNIGLKVLAFLAAAMLWFIVVNIDDPVTTRTYYNVPVSVINEEVLAEANQTYQIVDDTQSVNVTVRARRSVLDKITNKSIIAQADMKELTLKTQVPINIVIPGYEDRYEGAAASPLNLQVKLEDEVTKKFPIVPTTTGTVRDGYALGEIKAVPEKVTIRGPESTISRISRVEAEVSVSGLSHDTVLASEMVLYDDENNVIDQSLVANNLGLEGVGVSVQLLNTKNVSLKFDTSEIQPADGYEFSGIKYEPQEIQVMGAKEDLEGLSEIQIPADALYMTNVEKRTEKIVGIADYLPENIQLADENAGSVVVTVSVTKHGTQTYEVSLGSIVVENLDPDLTLEYSTVDALEIQVRGADHALQEFVANQSVSIDLSKYDKAGEYKVPVNVQLPADCRLEQAIYVDIILEEK